MVLLEHVAVGISNFLVWSQYQDLFINYQVLFVPDGGFKQCCDGHNKLFGKKEKVIFYNLLSLAFIFDGKCFVIFCVLKIENKYDCNKKGYLKIIATNFKFPHLLISDKIFLKGRGTSSCHRGSFGQSQKFVCHEANFPHLQYINYSTNSKHRTQRYFMENWGKGVPKTGLISLKLVDKKIYDLTVLPNNLLNKSEFYICLDITISSERPHTIPPK